MADNKDFFDEEIENYTSKYRSAMEEADFVDELFESSDGTPIKSWSMDDINKLIEDVENTPDIEEAGEEFEEDRYEDYSEPEEPDFEVEENEPQEIYDESAVYFSKQYEQNLVQKEAETVPTEFEDFSSVSDDFNETDDISFAAVEGNVNEARSDGEFREIDESLDVDGFEQNEVVYDGTFDRGDYIKIKDIFKNSKILSKRRIERAEIRESAIETVKEKYGEAVFDAKKKEADFNDILKRQRQVDREKREEAEKSKKETRFDVDSEDYVVTTKPEETVKPQKEKELNDTIFIEDLSSFEEVARTSNNDDFADTRVIADEEKPERTRNIYITPPSKRKNDDQMRFEGFQEEEDFLPEEVNEEEVEESLRKVREQKKNLFRMTSLPEDYDDTDPNYFSSEKGRYDEEEYMVLSDENHSHTFSALIKSTFTQERNRRFTEYTTSNEKPQVFKELTDRRRRSVFGIIAMSAITVLYVAISVVLFIFDPAGGTVSGSVLAPVSIICLLLTFVFGSSVTQPGLQGILKKNFGFDSAVTVAVLMCILSSLSAFFDLEGYGENYMLYTSAVLVCVIAACFARAGESSRAINALKTATMKRQNNLYTTQSIDDEAAADNIGRIFAGENPDLKYSCKTLFPAGFVHNSFAQNPADRYSRLFFPIALALSVVMGIIAGIIEKNVAVAFSAITVSMLLSFPLSVFYTLNTTLSSLNKKLGKKNACITGYTSVRNIEKTNALVVASTDLFDVGKCNFHGMKDYGTVRVDDIILYAAAMLTNARGPLAHVFDKAIIGDKEDLLPEVEDLCYEERLGLSGWIRGEKVLIGNRNLLVNHNMEAPPKGPEIGCIKEGKRVLYIAIGGQVAAMLVVEYAKNDGIKKYLGSLDRHGITIVVTTNDCNIDEEFLSLQFNMPRESFKVVGDFEGGLLDGCIHGVKSSAPAKLIHDETSESFFETFTCAVAYSSSIKITLAIQTVIMLLGIITSAVFIFTGNMTLISAFAVVLTQIVLSILITATSILRTKI